MLSGLRVLLRPMREEDIVTQQLFDQALELYGFDSAPPRVTSLEQTQRFYETRTKPDETLAAFAIEADGRYIGYCGLRDLQNRHGNLELGIMIGDRAYWGRGYGREVIHLLLRYQGHVKVGRVGRRSV
jgi:RimJ/RimL family protein N-acetyltransferase